jgi:hypothetical protein
MQKLFFVAATVAVCAAANAQIFSQDFESGLGGNESVSGSFLINNTNAPLNNGTMMMGHGTTYGNDEYSFYQVVLNLTNYTGVAMTFDYRGSFETHWDRFNVLASTGAITPPAGLITTTGASTMQFIDHGDTHHPNLGQFAYDSSALSGGTSGFATFDLSAFDGQTVTLRFQFGSDFSFTDAGINIDNLVVRGSLVPEPGTMAALGVGALALLRRRKKK